MSGRAGGYSNSYAFDLVGNPTSWKNTPQTFNSANQNTQNATLTFDGNGNPAGFSGTALNWDVNDNLFAFGNVLTAGYNADGLRAWKQTSSGRTYFLYNGLMPVCEVDGNGNVTAVNTWGATGLLARFVAGTGGGSVFYCFDPQGSASVRLDAVGNILSSHTNEAWGTQLSTIATNDPYAGYGGQWGYYKDVETGLHLLGHRYYDTSSGRFLNRDPIGYEGGINVYAYAEGNPVTGIDPTGLTVTITFNRSKGTLVATDDQTGASVTISGVFSGCGTSTNKPADEDKENQGPIPGGTYRVDTESGFGHYGPGYSQYRLYFEGKDGKWHYDHSPRKLKSGKEIDRGEHNLHPGSISLGCVTLPGINFNSPGWTKLRKLLNNTKIKTIKNSSGVKQKFLGKLIVE